MGFESLRERIKETYGTQAALAKTLGVNDTTLGTRLNGLSGCRRSRRKSWRSSCEKSNRIRMDRGREPS